MSCNWRARFELRAECGVNPPGEELSACREGGAERSKRSSEACRPSPVARKADLLVEVSGVSIERIDLQILHVVQSGDTL